MHLCVSHPGGRKVASSGLTAPAAPSASSTISRRTLPALSCLQAVVLVSAVLLIGLAGLARNGVGTATAAAPTQQLVVYTYDSFVNWGPAKEIQKRFQASHPGVELVWVAPGDSGTMFARLVGELQARRPTADVFVGLADSDLPAAIAQQVFQPLDYRLLPNLKDVPARLLLDPGRRVVPLDHGFITLVYDSQVIPPDRAPKTFADLLQPQWRKKIIAIDPAASSPGMAFLLWTIARFGDGPDGYLAYWKQLAPNLLTIAGGWSEAYSMFEQGEAPMVVSYSTDMAYSYISNHSTRYRIATLDGQGYEQVELMGIVTGVDSSRQRLAYEFLNFMLSTEVQALIPTTNWMFPANSQAPLPPDFARYAVTPAQPVRLPAETVAAHREQWLRAWSAQIRAY
ncbi:MAG: thiamine ABC transporter substrate-binding protein [Limnochordaceae bacterium]|nr:thiamine ABC transporter substrate-binding protein [Limnochordaceae bacterium]